MIGGGGGGGGGEYHSSEYDKLNHAKVSLQDMTINDMAVLQRIYS